VETQVAAKLLARLIERGVTYHCRKRMRTWCDCDYCRTKKEGSWEISLVGQYYSPTPRYYSLVDNWEIYAIIKARRLKKIQALRAKLKEAMEA